MKPVRPLFALFATKAAAEEKKLVTKEMTHKQNKYCLIQSTEY